METSPGRGPTDVATLLTLLQREPGRPRITWYGEQGERVELSGAVLVNWVIKTTNLLVEEFDVGPGSRVLLELPPHWRTPLWALAAWRAGACVVTAGPDEPGAAWSPVDTVVTTRPDTHAGAPDVVAVALPALARRWDGTLPPGALDAAAAVMTYGDALGPTLPADPTTPALEGGQDLVQHVDLLMYATQALPAAAASRVALPATGDVTTLLLRAVGAWAADGSVVLLHPTAVADAGALEALLHGEHVTARVP